VTGVAFTYMVVLAYAGAFLANRLVRVNGPIKVKYSRYHAPS
jgi:hypothetical protein